MHLEFVSGGNVLKAKVEMIVADVANRSDVSSMMIGEEIFKAAAKY